MRAPSVLVLCAAMLVATPLRAQSLDPRLFAGLEWRNVGPFRAGRISAASGAVGQPGVFYVDTPNGGVWKTTSAGETWFPIFDSIKTISSIGAVEVAPSDPNVVYVGTGDLNSYFDGRGDGMYKSSDGGRTWVEIVGASTGLPWLTGRLSIAVANGTNAQRIYLIGDFGLYRSDDGGTTWRHMAGDDKRIANAQGGYNSGVYVDSKNPDVVYTFHVTAYKSTDGGNSFTAFKGGPPGGDDPQVMWIDIN